MINILIHSGLVWCKYNLTILSVKLLKIATIYKCEQENLQVHTKKVINIVEKPHEQGVLTVLHLQTSGFFGGLSVVGTINHILFVVGHEEGCQRQCNYHAYKA